MGERDAADLGPFIRLTKVGIEAGRLRTSPLFLRPEDIKEIQNGRIYLSNGHHDVAETAIEIQHKTITKLTENRQAETMGK
jgi:hypothetical protein